MSLHHSAFAVIVLFVGFAFAHSPPSVTVDYIVAGAGTAGSVVAARLAEAGNIVLLLDQGSDQSMNPEVQVATLNTIIIGPPNEALLPVQTFFTTEKNLFNQYTEFHVARALGGGPAVSGSFWARGDPTDYDEWATLVGDHNLRYENLLPFFQRSESVSHADSSSPDRGRTGPVNVAILDDQDPSIQAVLSAFTNVFDVPIKQDYSTSSGQKNAVFPVQRSLVENAQCTATSGPCVRATTYRGYVEPLLNLPHSKLTVVTQATVARILFDDHGTALGVSYYHNAQSFEAYARKEVILSLGAVGSPKMLLISGVGEASFLESLSIPVVANVPGVGLNFQDHIAVEFAYGLVPTDVNQITQPSAISVAFLTSPFATNDMIDVEVAFGLLPGAALGVPFPVFSGFAVQVRGTTGSPSTGIVSIRSSDVTDLPVISFGFNTSNLDPLVWAMQQARQVGLTTGLSLAELVPGTAAIPLGATSAQYMQWMASTPKDKGIFPWDHTAGTCKMAAASDPLGVVDSHFKVRGTRNLRVVDNSVQPIVVNTHPSATATMLGELASHYILSGQ